MNRVRAELAAAVRRVNAAYARCPDPKPEVIGETWSALEAEIDAAITAGDADRAMRAIEAWDSHAREALGVASPR